LFKAVSARAASYLSMFETVVLSTGVVLQMWLFSPLGDWDHHTVWVNNIKEL
jgi:hypothetical protein